MTALIVLGIIAAIFIAIGFIRLGVGAKYDASGFAAEIKVAWKRIVLYPRQEKREKPAIAEKHKKEKPEKVEKEPKEKQNPLDMFGGLGGAIDFARDAIADFFDMVHTDRFVVEFVSAKKDDPAAVATNYGYACAVAGIISAMLDNNRNVKYYSIKLDMDYEASRPRVSGEMKISVSIGRLVRFAFSKGMHLLILMIKNGRKKGGTDNGKANIEYA